MLNKILLLFFTITFFSHSIALGQEKVFTELEINSNIWEKGKWTLNFSSSWKHLIQKNGWNRPSFNLKINRKLGNWGAEGGLKNYYTFNKTISNYYELRPWVGLSLNTPIIKRFSFKQSIKWEWRFLFFSDETLNDNYPRFRYNLTLKLVLAKNEEKQTQWAMKGYTEWYLIKNPANGERFPNFREYGLIFSRKTKTRLIISFGYRLEQYYTDNQQKNGNGHVMYLGLGF